MANGSSSAGGWAAGSPVLRETVTRGALEGRGPRGEILFVLPPPVAWDGGSKGVDGAVEPLAYRVEPVEDGWLLSVSVPASYLQYFKSSSYTHFMYLKNELY